MENRIGVQIASTIGAGIQMITTFQITIEILVGTFFLVAAIACLLWPDKFYEHALRPVCQKADIRDKSIQKMQRRRTGGSVMSQNALQKYTDCLIPKRRQIPEHV